MELVNQLKLGLERRQGPKSEGTATIIVTIAVMIQIYSLVLVARYDMKALLTLVDLMVSIMLGLSRDIYYNGYRLQGGGAHV